MSTQKIFSMSLFFTKKRLKNLKNWVITIVLNC